MDKQQYELACGIVKVDCYGTGTMRNHGGVTCAVGALYASIYPDWVGDTEPFLLSHIEQEVGDAFGMTYDELYVVVEANDNEGSSLRPLDSRRKRVRRALLKIYNSYEVD